jgi:hypothetical protein
MRIGANGGFMGHVMVVLDAPRQCHPDEAIVQHVRESDFDLEDVPEVWCVRTMESTSSKAGLFETTMIMASQRSSGRLFFVGELTDQNELAILEEVESVEIWQPPSNLRAQMRSGLMEEVIDEMRMHDWASWSLGTAFRALVTANAFQNSVANRGKLLKEIKESWDSDPICTSVVIIFWQKYLCRLAEVSSSHATDHIMRWMATKADRALPGELLSSMRESGWSNIRKMQPTARFSARAAFGGA